VIIFITVLGHQKVLSLSHFTCFVHLPYLEKLLNTKIRTFSCKQFFVMFIKLRNNLVAAIGFGILFILHKLTKIPNVSHVQSEKVKLPFDDL